jgi:hypothetical protein
MCGGAGLDHVLDLRTKIQKSPLSGTHQRHGPRLRRDAFVRR